MGGYRALRLQYPGEGKLFHLRTKDGAEVDFVIERDDTLTPVEVIWSERLTVQDARQLLAFLVEHPKQARPHHLPVLSSDARARSGNALSRFCL